MQDESSTPTKKCTKCGRELPATLEFFNGQSKTRDGLMYECKKCFAKRRATYNAAHRDEQHAYDKQYRATHAKEKSARAAAYYQAHREERIAYTARYRAAHPGYWAEYVASPAGHDIAMAHRRNRRARERGALGVHTPADVQAQRNRQHGVCYWQITDECRERGGKLGKHWHVDHVIPLARGGSNGPENLVIACPACNQTKSAKMPWEIGRLC